MIYLNGTTTIYGTVNFGSGSLWTSPPPPADSTLLNGLQHLWEMNETSGTVMVDSTGNQNGTYVNTSINQTGIMDKAISLTDSNSTYVDTNVVWNEIESTMSAWLKFTSTLNDKRFISNYTSGTPVGGMFIGEGGNGDSLYCSVQGPSGQTFTAPSVGLNDGNWHHVVLRVESGGTMDLWLDGIEKTTQAMEAYTPVVSAQFKLGINQGNNTGMAQTLDQIGLWNRKLTNTEILELYNNGYGIQHPFTDVGSTLLNGIEAYYKMDETSGTSVADTVGSATGTIIGGVMSSGGLINYGYENNTATSDRIDVGTSLNSVIDYNIPWSVNLWIKFDTQTSTRVLFANQDVANGRGMYIASTGANAIYGFLGNNGTNRIAWQTSDGVIPTDGVWYMITKTFDGSGLIGGFTIYINGSEVANTFPTGTEVTATTVSADSLLIGNFPSSLIYAPDGVMDEVGVWSKELTQSEVTELYNSGNGNQYPF